MSTYRISLLLTNC